MKQILFRLFENLKQLGIKPNIGSRTNVTPIPGSEIDRLINRPVTPKEFDYSKPEVVDSIRGIVKNASDYVGQFTERQAKTFNDNIERILNVIKPKETTADVVDLATKEKITGPGLESLMKEKGVPSISRKTIEAETLIKQFLDDDLISLNAKQIDQLSRGKAEDVFENIFGSKAKELITGKNTNESLNEVYNKLKNTKDVKGRLPDDPSFDPSDIEFKEGGSVSEDVRQLLKEEFIKIINEDPEAYPDTNAGFRRFLKRKGAPVFNYKDGGEVEEKEEKDILEKFGTLYKRKKEKKDGKLGPTDPLSKYESYSEEELAGNIEAKKPTFDTLEDYIMETMPIFEPKDVAPPKSYSPMPVEKYLTRRLFIDLAKGGRVKKRKRYADGGVASMFRERPGYAEGGNIIYKGDDDFFLNFQKGVGFVRGPNGWEFNGYIAPESNLPKGYSIKDAGRDEDGNIIKEIFKDPNSTGTSIPTTTEIPTVDPFSGQQVSAQEQAAFTQPQQDMFPTTLQGRPIEWKLADPERGASGGYYNVFTDVGIPSVASAQKTLQNFLGNLYSGPEIANMQEQTFGSSNLPGQTGVVSDLRHATAASQVRDKIADAVSMGYFNPSGIIPQSLGLFGSQVLGAANEIQSIRPNMQSLRDIGEDLRANFYGATQVPYGQSANTTYNQLLNNPSLPSAANYQRTVNVGSADPGLQALGRSIGGLDFATMNALRNNADLLNTITGQTVNMANGGLTNTIPPARGPNSQGVESLFTRRYN
jgi:hypothetical protein